MSAFKKYLLESQIIYDLLIESTRLNKEFINKSFGNEADFAKKEKEVESYFASKVDSVISPELKSRDQYVSIMKNFAKFAVLSGDISASEICDLYHDIVSEFGVQTLVQKYIPLMKTDDDKVEKIKELYAKNKAEKDEKVKNSDVTSVVADKSYVELSGQDGKVKIEDFKGTGETKVVDIGNKAKWFVAKTFSDEELEKFGITKIFASSQDKEALKSAAKWEGLPEELLRGACPASAKNAGHCGNVPSLQKGDVIFVLTDDGTKNGRHVNTLILDKDGKIRESKGPYNQTPDEKYINNYLWLLNHINVKGSIWGGYAPSTNAFLYRHPDDEIKSHFYDGHAKGKEFTQEEKDVNTLRKQYLAGEVTLEELLNAAGFVM